MNRIDRLHAILTHLQGRKKVTAQQIADRFSISLRTVYRDVKALEEGGVPVIGEAGSGYSIMEGYRLPPLMFSQEEAAALLLGAKLASEMTDSGVQRNMEEAMYKIRAVLRTTDKDFVEQLLPNIEVSVPRHRKTTQADRRLLQLQKAIAERKLIFMRYRSGNEEATERKVEPVGLWHYGQHWHLIGWCRLRNGYRDFRVNRIQSLELREEQYKVRSFASLKEYIDSGAGMPPGMMQEAVILFDKKHANYISESKYQAGFIQQLEAGDKLRLFFLTPSLDYFARWLLTYTDLVTIESPASLKQIMKKLIAELKKAHG